MGGAVHLRSFRFALAAGWGATEEDKSHLLDETESMEIARVCPDAQTHQRLCAASQVSTFRTLGCGVLPISSTTQLQIPDQC